MKALRRLLIALGAVFLSLNLTAQNYRSMMYDPNVNFYDVVDEAEAYFATEGTGEGSGFKGFQRWKFQNEPNFYPDGNRRERNQYFAANQYKLFLQNNALSASVPAWRDLGPYQIQDLAAGYNPGLGRVESFYVNPGDTNMIYLGSRSGGFWRSLDGGQSWQSSTTDFLFASGVNAIAVSPTNPDSVLINLRNARNGTSHGVYRSVDGGMTWDTTVFNPGNLGWGGLGSNAQVYEVAYHPQIPNRVYIGTSSGLYVSDDNLLSYTRYLNAATITAITFHPTDTGVVYVYNNGSASQRDKILVSEDGGRNFTATSSLPGNGNTELHLSVSPVCPDCIYAASNTGVWKTVHRDSAFTFLSNPPKTCDGFAVNDQDTSLMVYGMLEIYVSYDGGKNFILEMDWTTGRNPFYGGKYIHADLRRARSINGTFYLATDGYLGKTFAPSQSWLRLSTGTGIRENYAVGVCQGNDYINLCGSQDNGSSLLRRKGWLEVYGADGMEGIVHPLNPDYMISSYQYGGRMRSTDQGWSVNNVLTHTNAYWEAPLLWDPNHQMRVYSFGRNIMKSEDFGLNWSQVNAQTFSSNIMHAAISNANSDVMVVSRTRFLEISRDGGQTFNNIWAGLPSSSITDVAFAPGSDSILVVTYATHSNNGNKVYLSKDQGNTWQNITYNLGDMPLRSVAVDFTDDQNIYVGAEIGVYTMPMNSNSWSLYNQSLPNCTMSDLEIMWGSNTLRGATWGRGLWETDLVGRENHPKIMTTNIDFGPLVDAFGGGHPSGGNDQNVRSKIEYSGSLTSVYLKWSANDFDLDSTITMTKVDSLWQTVRPIKAPGNSDIYFKVYAVGSNGDTTETYRFMYHTFGSGVGIDELAEKSLKVYPNPSTGKFTIKWPSKMSITDLSLMDGQGKHLMDIESENSDGAEIDISHLPNGVYVIQYTNAGQKTSHKIIKQ